MSPEIVLPHHLADREAQIADAVTTELEERGTYNPATDEALVRQYAMNLVAAEHLTEEARRHDPASQEHRRISNAAARHSRLAAMYASKLKLGGKKAKPAPAVPLHELFGPSHPEPWTDEHYVEQERADLARAHESDYLRTQAEHQCVSVEEVWRRHRSMAVAEFVEVFGRKPEGMT